MSSCKMLNRGLVACVAMCFGWGALWADDTSVERPDGLTDLTSPSGAAVTSENLLNSMSPQKAFNDSTSLTDTGNRFITNNKKTAVLVYTFDDATAVNAIGIQNFNNSDCQTRSPKAWTFWGSNDFDGTREGIDTATWTLLDTRSSETDWAKPEYRYYQFENNKRYKSYKISFTDTNGNSYLQLQKLEYFYYVASGVEILGDPSPCGDFSYDMIKPEAGSTVNLSAFDGTWTNADGTMSATCVGYEAVTTDAAGNPVTLASGTGTTCSFTMPDGLVRLTWRFNRSFKVTVNAGEHGSVSGVDDWYAEGSVFAPTVTADEGYGFFKWTIAGESSPNFDESFVVAKAMTVTPVFAPVVMLEEGDNKINDALASATDDPLILRLAAGTYNESSGTANSIVLEKPVRIEGIGETPSEVTLTRVIANARIFKMDHADAVVKNVTISGGYGQGNAQPIEGGNVYITANGGTIMDSIVTGGSVNTYNSCGGNIRMLGGHILRCVIQNGWAQTGYGAQGGGGINASGSSLIENCLVKGNKIGTANSNSATAAAGLRLSGSAKAVNCTIVENGGTACANGGVYASDSAQVINCAIFNNQATSSGTGYNQTWGGSALAFVNCSADVLINDACFQTDAPAFTDAPNGDYTLSVSSPLRDKGAAYGSTGASSATDLAGTVRVSGTGVDIGAYEFVLSGLSCDFTADKAGGLTPCTVTFTASVEGDSGSVLYEWDFDGDGMVDERTTDGVVAHNYVTAGTFSVSLSVVSGLSTASASHADMIKTCQKTLYVATDGSGEFPFASWDTAATSIAAAVEAALDGCDILVADGAYVQTEEVVVKKAVRIVGVNGTPSSVTVTSSGSRIFNIDNAGALIANMDLKGGAVNGGTISISNSGGTISNCTVRASGAAVGWGQGGAAIRASKALVTHCKITGVGQTHLGDGLSRGGAVHFDSKSSLVNSLVTECDITYTAGNNGSQGGNIVSLNSGSTAVNCTVVNCTNNFEISGGIYADSSSFATNCVVYDVRNPSGDGASTWYAGVAGNFVNCGTAELTASAFKNYAGGDYRPSSNGALLDKGTMEGLAVPATDLAGNLRVKGKTIDIGCYEGNPAGLFLYVR